MRNIAVAWLAALLATPIAARADDTPSAAFAYKQVARFRVEYHDLLLGAVTGDAFCKWASPILPPAPGTRFSSSPNFGNSTEKRPHCHVRLYNPSTGVISDLTAVGDDIREPATSTDHLVITLHGQSPAAAKQLPMKGKPVAAHAGGQGSITVKNGDTETKYSVPIMQRAAVDDASVTLDFSLDDGGALSGSWNYYADMSSERDAQGSGRVGTVVPLKDGPGGSGSVPARTGGFKGLEKGAEIWRPLEPRIYAVHVMEDQAGFDNNEAKYSLNRINQSNTDANRTLVIFGHDLPALDGEDFAGIRSKTPDGLFYRVVGDSRAKSLSNDNKQKIDQAIVEESANLAPNYAQHLRSMQAVVVLVEQKEIREPGPRFLDWGGAEWEWQLQYGDNTAIARFIRIVRQNDYPSAPSVPVDTRPLQYDYTQRAKPVAPQPLYETETVTDLSLPDRVVVEVQTGGPNPVRTIPVVLGGEALGGKTIAVTATQLAGRPTVYRTDPLVFTATGVTPADASPETLIPVTQGARIFAKIDEATTHFLRRGMAIAYATPPSTTWLKALNKAGYCRGRTFNPTDWANFAKQTTETITKWTHDVDITYGDHAAMLILRDALLQAMRRNFVELGAVGREAISSDGKDQLIDGWYRSAHDVVALAPDSPLATFLVDSPGGKVPFAQAYSKAFEIATFQTNTDPDGVAKFRDWRRHAAHAALDFFRLTIAQAMVDDSKVDDCDRQGLLQLAGSIGAGAPRGRSSAGGSAGGKSLIASISPLLMKSRTPNAVTEPELIARAYVGTVDQLVARLQAVKEYSALINKAIVTAVTALVPFPAAFTLGSAVVQVAVAGEAVAVTLTVSVGGLVNFGYSAGNEIYDTYKGHADVAFAYAHYQTLGIDHYLDAQSLAEPWWKTIRSIFGDAIMNFVDVLSLRQAEIFDEGAMLARGAKVAQRMTNADAPLVTALADEDRAALALFMAKEEQIMASRGIVSRAGQTSEAILERLAGRAAAEAGASADAMAIEKQLETKAMAEVAEPVAAGKAPPAEIEKPVAEEGFAAQGETAELEDQAQRSIDASVAPAAQPVGRIPQVDGTPFLRDVEETINPGAYVVAPTGQTPVTVEIDGFIGAGSFAQVYGLKGVPEGLPVPLKQSLQGKKLVVKFIKKPAPGKFTVPEYDEVTNESISKELEALRSDTSARLKHAEEVLGAAGQSGVPHAEFQVFEDYGFVIQERIEASDTLQFLPKPENLKQLQLKEWDDGRRSIAKLAKKLIDGGIEMHDFNPGNIYLEKAGGGWVAKILDADFINRFGERRLAGGEEFFYYGLNTSVSSSPFSVYSPLAAQMNILERNKWLQFNGATKVDGPGFMKPSDFNGILDWNAFHPPAPPPPPPPPPIVWTPLPIDLGSLQQKIPAASPQRIGLPPGMAPLPPPPAQ